MAELLTQDIRIEVLDKIQQILDKSHNNLEKRRFRESQGRVNFACPYCGDSHSDEKKKRGNLYWESLSFHCFNCNKHRNLDAFLVDFEKGFEGQKRIDLVNFIRDNAVYAIPQSIKFELFRKLEAIAVTKEDFFRAMQVYPVTDQSKRVYPYLKSRMLINRLERFGYDPRKQTLYIFNLSSDGKKIIGYQTRYLGVNSATKYLSYNFQKMMDKLGRKFETTQEELESFNRISLLFGILQTDLSRDFTVFEGPIDAMFMRNSLALTGVLKSTFNFDELESVRYFLDNDFEGKKKMMEKIKIGKRVFLWKKFIEDYRLQRHSIKDLNDLVKVAFNSNKPELLKNLNIYFSDNNKDIIYV
jgi:hypothetical protein